MQHLVCAIFIFQTRSRQEIGSNISMYDQVRFKNQTELRPVLTKKIEQYFEIEKN